MSKDLALSQQHIENRIFTIRGKQVMFDRDLAEMYQVEVKRLNEQVKRNIDRFPETFRFQLNTQEKDELVANCDRFESLKHSAVNPYAFTEQGVAMLSAVLRSDIAVKVSIQIMNAFVELRKLVGQETLQHLRLSGIENKLIEHDQKFNKLFSALENNELPQRGVYFDGQVFDAYTFISDIIKTAKTSIILIDNYVDDRTLTLFTKRKKNVSVSIYTAGITKQFRLDLEKHNIQYPGIKAELFKKSHDRFLIIDDKELYHIGASLKDLGKKWFAFSRMDSLCKDVLSKIKGGE
ncbi:ORF6N domain-containing protein [Sphingobacterium oryzagri]|uniref:ORF6N domain-containing protein n=1 Tax=Sphingobacterium oryzagri TaxID=3025669 RepID=A0ABY7WL89_9SPHI|nr:ORF6N domain-containing protein [Sphingobacterium sp. KACC 22765]WDF70366.1 ORF6N domain-containing protein [Sphingobacterium sp. KACC 22765]